MKTTLIAVLCLLVLSASQCKKEGDDCHYSITLNNNAPSDILYGWKIKNTSGECNLSLRRIKSAETFEINRNNCWENILGNGRTVDIYIVALSNYNDPNVFYPCDSIEIKNTVLAHYILTLEDLKSTNFTVTYP